MDVLEQLGSLTGGNCWNELCSARIHLPTLEVGQDVCNIDAPVYVAGDNGSQDPVYKRQHVSHTLVCTHTHAPMHIWKNITGF